MSETEFELHLAQIQALVCRVQELTRHPNFQPGVFPPNFVIPHPSEALPPPMSWQRIVAGSAGAAVSVVCFAITVMLSLVNT